MALGVLELIGGVLETLDLVGAVTEAGRRRHSGRQLAAGWALTVAGGAGFVLWFAPLRDRVGGWAVAVGVAWAALLLYMLLASGAALLASPRLPRRRP